MTRWREEKGRLALRRELLSTFHFPIGLVCDPRVPATSRSKRPGPSITQLRPGRLAGAGEHPAPPARAGPRPLLQDNHKQCNVNSPSCLRMSLAALKGQVSAQEQVIPPLLPHRLTHHVVSSEALFPTALGIDIRPVLSTKVTRL